MVTVSDGTQIKMLIHKPKNFNREKSPAYFYAHGGGAFALEAKLMTPMLSHSCVNLNTIMFNIDYRKGPEVKCPTGQQDFVDAINHVLANAEKYGIDTDKTCIAGASGGGWIIGGAANLMVKSNTIDKIKAVFMHTGMLSHEVGKIPED
jgi:acetyl esterase